jgi:hypothetical protein
LFGIYIDDLEAFLHGHIQDSDKCRLHQVMISILLLVDGVVLLASSPKRLQRQLDSLALFCDLRQLTVNLGKTKVMIFNESKNIVDLHFFFNGSKNTIDLNFFFNRSKNTVDLHFFFNKEEIEITNSYTYLAVRFSQLHFSL